MLGFALWMRIEEYGITYNRYLLAGFGLWLVLMSLYFMLFGKAQQKWLFFFASLFIFVSQFGPYSADNVTKQSQTARLVQLISTATPRSEELDMKRKYEISNGLDYIENHYGVDAFKTIIPHILEKYKIAKKKQKDNKGVEAANTEYVYNFASFATKELGFKHINKWEWQHYRRDGGKGRKDDYYFYATATQESIDIKGYSQLINYHYNEYRYKSLRGEAEFAKDPDLRVSFANNQFQIKKSDNNDSTFDLNDYVAKLMKQNNASHDIAQKVPIYESSNIKILFQRLQISHDGNITDFDSQILLKD
jgi:hypothetical protein